ncbi:MAG TPA: hypothetical protein VGJ05_08830 [Fimbriiglobus sp.]|jgi:hypothetical protein
MARLSESTRPTGETAKLAAYGRMADAVDDAIDAALRAAALRAKYEQLVGRRRQRQRRKTAGGAR